MQRGICPICGCNHLEELLLLPQVPVFVNVLPDNAEDAKSFLRGDQRLTLCKHCGFIFNSAFEPQKVIYNDEYHAERANSAYYLDHIDYVLDLIDSVSPIRNRNLLEVACGSGEFLKEAVKRKPRNAIGVDPSAYEIEDAPLHLHKALFDEDYLNKLSDPVDILINRHMIEHILNPLEMLKRFHRALVDGGILYLETPRLDWILENRVFFDFSYEHCAYYSDKFIVRLLKMAGFEVIKLANSYEGQYFSICARKSVYQPMTISMSIAEAEVLQIRELFSTLSNAYNRLNRIETYQRFCTETLRTDVSVRNHCSTAPNTVYLWGASGKGVMCANLLDQWPIAGLIDQNPYKQGRYVPGDGALIISPDNIAYPAVQAVLVENDVYLDEIRASAKKIDLRIQVCSLCQMLNK